MSWNGSESPLTGARYSVVVPVYGNEDTLVDLIDRLEGIAVRLPGELEVIFVVDGSPDDSVQVLRERLAFSSIRSQVLEHSRNFGAFLAIRTGLGAATGEFVGVMAADLQEPPELMLEFFDGLEHGGAQVVVGKRISREDPALSTYLSRAYWAVYRRFIMREIPRGGVDVFAVRREVVTQLLALQESHSSLVGLLFWVGFRRLEIPYARLERPSGVSGWTLRKKLRYMSDSVFSFTDIPVRVLTTIGGVGTVLSSLAAVVVFGAWLLGRIPEPGYTPLMISILFSTFIMLFGLGIVGSYVWRTYENSKGRPLAIVATQYSYAEPL